MLRLLHPIVRLFSTRRAWARWCTWRFERDERRAAPDRAAAARQNLRARMYRDALDASTMETSKVDECVRYAFHSAQLPPRVRSVERDGVKIVYPVDSYDVLNGYGDVIASYGSALHDSIRATVGLTDEMHEAAVVAHRHAQEHWTTFEESLADEGVDVDEAAVQQQFLDDVARQRP